jgi:hypothetical protein
MNSQPNYNYNQSRYVENKSYDFLKPNDSQYWSNNLAQPVPTNRYYQYPVQYSSNLSNQAYQGQSLMDLRYSGFNNQQGNYYQPSQFGYAYGSNQTNDNNNLPINNYYPSKDLNSSNQIDPSGNHQLHTQHYQHNLNKINNNPSK